MQQCADIYLLQLLHLVGFLLTLNCDARNRKFKIQSHAWQQCALRRSACSSASNLSCWQYCRMWKLSRIMKFCQWMDCCKWPASSIHTTKRSLNPWHSCKWWVTSRCCAMYISDCKCVICNWFTLLVLETGPCKRLKLSVLSHHVA